MRELALHLLDILQNAVEAGAARVTLTMDEDIPADRLAISVADDGRGMDAETAARVTDAFYTTRTTRHVGLGLPLYAAAAERAGGGVTIRSQPGVGTTVTATFQLSHPDRQPLGDMTATLLAFLLSDRAPELHYEHRIRRGGAFAEHREGMAGGAVSAQGMPVEGSPVRIFEFDTVDIRAELGEVPLAHPAVVGWLAAFLEDGESVLRDE